MKKDLINYFKETSKYWWTSLLVGIIAIIVGIWCIASPDVTLIALTYIFIAAFFIGGIIDIIFAVSNRDIFDGWGWTLSGGIIDIIFGIILLVLPLPAITLVLVYFVGFWIMFRSILTIGVAIEMNRYTNVASLLVLGILSLIFSVIYLLSPVFGGATIVAFAFVAFTLYGMFRIYYSIKLQKLNKEINKRVNQSK